jgi:hypothetical protein
VLILDLYFLQLELQIGFEGLNLQAPAEVALTHPNPSRSTYAQA